MDPITDLPATAEPGAHVAHAANPTPTHVPNHNHPPYAEMITAAITALKDKDGSSRQAIAKYIEKAYTNLPPSHSALLTTHLKRLKNNGQLVMIKHSYALPGSTPFPTPEFPAATTTLSPANASSSGPKRKPGRPPKARPDVQFQQPMSIPVTEPVPGEAQAYSVAAPGFGHAAPAYSVAAPGYGPEVPAYSVAAPGFGSETQAYPGFATGTGQEVHTYPVGGPEPMFVSLGLDDGPVAPPSVAAPTTVTKRGRGRPPRVTNGPVPTDSSGPTSLGKRARGRPIKPRSITEIMSNGGLKKARGRPRVTTPVIVPLGGGSPRPQGRPKRGRSSGQKPTGRPRGRPAKNGGKLTVPLDVLGDGVVSARRPGRPARNGIAKMPRKLSGTPVGRPRKSSAVTAVLVTDPQQLVAYQELKNKLEHIQSKIKQTVNVVRPCLNHDAVSALGALQELEVLATGEASAPVNVHGQEPPQLLHGQDNLF